MKHLIWLLSLSILVCGCASTRMYVYTLADPDYKDFSQSKKVVIMSKVADLEEKRVKSVLTRAVNKSGFEVVTDVKDADVGLLFKRETVSKSELQSYRVPVTKTTTGYIGEKRVDFTTYDEKEMTYTHRYTFNKLWLDVYSLENGKKSELPIWQAYGEIEKSLYNKFEEGSMETMLNFYGKSYNNWTSIIFSQ